MTGWQVVGWLTVFAVILLMIFGVISLGDAPVHLDEMR